MATTTNFGWETPDDTDLVKDGALAMRTLGNAIDTSLVDLKGGTTGQNLRKNTNTDMDFVWAGDATNTVIDAEGDLLVGDSADTLQRLAIGTTGQVLTVDTTIDGKIKWAAAAGGGKVLQVVQGTSTTATTVSTTTLTDTSLSVSITPSSATSKVLIIVAQSVYSSRNDSDCYSKMALLRGATAILTTASNNAAGFATDGLTPSALKLRIYIPLMYLDSPNTTSATTYKTQGAPSFSSNSGQVVYQEASSPSHIIALEIGA